MALRLYQELAVVWRSRLMSTTAKQHSLFWRLGLKLAGKMTLDASISWFCWFATGSLSELVEVLFSAVWRDSVRCRQRRRGPTAGGVRWAAAVAERRCAGPSPTPTSAPRCRQQVRPIVVDRQLPPVRLRGARPLPGDWETVPRGRWLWAGRRRLDRRFRVVSEPSRCYWIAMAPWQKTYLVPSQNKYKNAKRCPSIVAWRYKRTYNF